MHPIYNEIFSYLACVVLSPVLSKYFAPYHLPIGLSRSIHVRKQTHFLLQNDSA